MIKVLIIEDEFNVLEALKKMLKLIDRSMDLVADTGFVSEAVTLIKEHQPDLVFMDIELEDGTGFDILKQLDKLTFKIIFTTAYNQYAIKAFKYAATDYLLKPIDPIELREAVNRAKKGIIDTREHQELLQVLNQNKTEHPKKIILKTTEQRYVISVEEIIRLEADGAYTLFVLADRKIIVSKNLRYYQDLLPDNFVRCHQSHLVNSKQIVSLNKSGLLFMKNKELIPVSTRRKVSILQVIESL
jgi:two-component system LytT family response regulator